MKTQFSVKFVKKKPLLTSKNVMRSAFKRNKLKNKRCDNNCLFNSDVRMDNKKF